MAKDGTPIRIDGVLTYRIDSLGEFLTASEDTDWLLSEFAEAGLQTTLSELTFKQFHSEPRKLERKIRRELQSQSGKAGFGVTIQYFRIKKFKVICPTAQTALAVDVLVDAIQRIPDQLADRAGQNHLAGRDDDDVITQVLNEIERRLGVSIDGLDIRLLASRDGNGTSDPNLS